MTCPFLGLNLKSLIMKSKTTMFLIFLNIYPIIGLGSGNEAISNFRDAKELLAKIYGASNKTFYCNSSYSGNYVDLESCGVKISKYIKRSKRIEWEHIVPAENFGRSFSEWRDGHSKCKNKSKSYKGRRCASKVSGEFRRMEADLYNLVPAVGSINAARSNYSFAEDLNVFAPQFGKCDLKIINRKVEPQDNIKGDIARIFFYMDSAYPNRGILGKQRRKLMEIWDKMDPVTLEECQINKKKKRIQGNDNPFVSQRCP